MPIMPADYFSTWYVITIGGMPTILQSYNETLNQAVSDKKLVQGDIGNHVVDIAPTYYQYNLNCHACSEIEPSCHLISPLTGAVFIFSKLGCLTLPIQVIQDFPFF